MTPTETAQVLAYVKTLDQRFRVPETPAERDFMTRSWSGLLVDVPMQAARESVERHYRSTTETITPNAILVRWRTERSRVAYDVHRGEGWRRCRITACSCTHTECVDGWLDEELETVRNGRTYRQVQRCPRCSAYLDETKREREAGRPW